MEIQILEESSFPDEALPLFQEDQRATLYLHPRWMHAVKEAYPRFRSSYLVLREDDHLRGIIPLVEVRQLGLREVVSMPFGTHGGPVLASDVSPQGVQELISRFVTRLKKFGTFRFEMAIFDPSPLVREVLEAALGSHLISATTSVLDLSGGPDQIWQNYEQQVRRSVRRAENSGVVVRQIPGKAGIDIFHRLYTEQSKTWPLSWHHSRRALRAIAKAMDGGARTWVAFKGGEELCAQLVLCHEKEMHLWLSGAHPKSRPLAAFHLLLHTLINDGSRKGFVECNFGTSMNEIGVEKFKRSFGPKDKVLARFYHQSRWAEWVQRRRWGTA